MLRRLTLFIVFISCIHLGFWWVTEESNKKTEIQKETNEPEDTSQTSVRKTNFYKNPIPNTPKPILNPKWVKVPAPPTLKPRVSPDIISLQNEIHNIIELNKIIKNMQSGKSGQLSRIQDQASIHQKILEKIKSNTAVSSDSENLEGDALITREKLRIIRQQTEQNRILLESLQNQKSIASEENIENDF